MSEKEIKSYKTIEEQLGRGSIMESYGSNYLFTVCPWFGGHKVRFSVVKLGTKGQEHLDFFLDIDKFRRFLDEVNNGIVFKKIQADKSNFPSAIEFRTGKDGCKQLLIGGGAKGARVQIKNKVGDNWNFFPPTVFEMEKLKDLSFYFKLVSGMTLVRKGSYYDSLYDAYWKGAEARDKNFKNNYDADIDEEYVENDAEDNSDQNESEPAKSDSTTTQTVPAEESTNKATENKASENKDTPKSSNESASEMKTGTLYMLTPIEKKKCGFTAQVSLENPENYNSGVEYEKNAKRYNCIFTKDLIDSMKVKGNPIDEQTFANVVSPMIPNAAENNFPCWPSSFEVMKYTGTNGKEQNVIMLRKIAIKKTA